MEFVLSRHSPATVQEQLRAQIEAKILSGELPSGARVPSVRALAIRLKIHRNTVVHVYSGLAADGLLERRPRAAGLFVRRGVGGAGRPESLDELLQLALTTALRQGYRPDEIRSGVARWLEAPAPSSLVVLDTYRETAEILVEEIRMKLGIAAASRTFDDTCDIAEGALAITWPLHLEALRRLVSADRIVSLRLELAAGFAEALRALPRDGILLLVSHSPRVLQYACSLVNSVRGDDVLVKAHAVHDVAHWRPLASIAHTVFVDVLSAARVRACRAHGVREFHLITEETCEEIRQRLAFVLPRMGRPRPSAGRDAVTR